MKFIDKLKNIFFEEEEDIEIEDTRPLQKVKEKENKKEHEKEKEIIAKKVEIPKRKQKVEDNINENIEEIKFDIPKEEDNEDNIDYVEISKDTPKKESKITEIIFNDDDFILDAKKEEKVEIPSYKSRENREKYPVGEVKETPSYDYAKKEEPKKTGFTPSPIISPIYGILDKNYKKEEVKEKKEIRITSRVGRVDFDSVRNKAFGDLENEIFSGNPVSDMEDEKEELPKEDIKKFRNKIEDEGKPVIDKVTLGEADEYYTDLGLAYNTDYKDVSKEINDGKIKKDNTKKGDKLEDNLFDLIETMYDKED